MNGLNAYPRSVPRFQSGGIMGTAPEGGGFFSPIAGTPTVAGFGVTPATLAGLAVPAIAGPLGLIGLTVGAINAFNAKQDPAPVRDAKTAAEVEAEQAQMDATIAAAQDAEDAEQGLAMMNQMQAQPDPDVSPVDVAMDVAATVAATQDAVDAEGGQTVGVGTPSGVGTDTGAGGGVEGGGGGGSTATGGSDTSSTGSGASDTGAATGGWRMGGQVMSYQQGGQIMNYAQGGEAYGRGGDSMLVHMNPREVAGLQALARSNGTSMTINPNTGYPEAFNLKALLPALIGLGLNAFAPGVGSAVGQALGTSSAVGTGVAVGGATALGTGSLKKGIMAGLGAYGGAGLGEGLAGSGLAGTPPPTPGMEGVAGSGLSTTPPPTDPSLVGNQYSLSSGNPSGFNADPTDPLFKSTSRSLTTPTSFTSANMGTGVTTPSVFPPQPEVYEVMGASPGGTGATVSPSTTMSSVTKPGLTTGQAFKYGSAALTPAMQPEPYEAPKSTAMIRPYDFEYNPQTGAYDRPAGDTSEAAYFSPTFTARDPYLAAAGGGLMDSMRSVDFDKEDNYYAAGGLTAFKQGGRPKSRPLMGEDYYRFMGRDDTMLGTAEKNFAGGGTPRFLSGGGDGMSDDIPAVIGDKQPARLADGEFVIPADVVSHLGNGSSKAGAKRLYEMMADIRRERTGTKKQAPAIKPSKFMPA
jgi:hypothetical protein